MAIPIDPLFDKSTLASLNAKVRTLGMPSNRHVQISDYLAAPGIGANTVAAWLYPQKTTAAGQKEVTTPVLWADLYKKEDMLVRLGSHGKKQVKREVILNYLNAEYIRRGEPQLLKSNTKDQLLYELEKKRYTKGFIGALLDREVPLSEVSIVDVPATTRPDMLLDEEYLGTLLSSHPRGGYLRKKADLALALCGAVEQVPQDGQEEASFLGLPPARPGAGGLADTEREIWAYRQNKDIDPFLGEMWFRIMLLPSEQDYWRIKVDYFQVYDATEFDWTEGWPTRAPLKVFPLRTQQEIEDKIKEKAGYDAYLAEKARRRREKQKSAKKQGTQKPKKKGKK